MISDNILIIDDDKRIIESLKLALSQYQLITFTDPQEALMYLSKPNMIDLVLLDVYMTKKNGLEVLDIIKKINPTLPVMMLTGHATQEIIIEALRSHADDFIEKPFQVSQLRQRVKMLLNRQAYLKIDSKEYQGHVLKIKSFIERNYAQASLEYVARELNLSPKYVSRLFINEDKDGFRAYKLKIRMQHAMDLLKNTVLTISEIAEKLSYENPESFMRIFKRYYGKTPTDFRLGR